MIKVTENLFVADEELRFTSSRSGGPGGQNVNKVNTRVTLWFDLEGSRSLSMEQKEKIRKRLANRVNKNGLLRVVSQRHRTQAGNKKAAIERFGELLRQALKDQTPRKNTKLPESVKQRRLEEKTHRSQVKKQRSKRISWDN